MDETRVGGIAAAEGEGMVTFVDVPGDEGGNFGIRSCYEVAHIHTVKLKSNGNETVDIFRDRY